MTPFASSIFFSETRTGLEISASVAFDLAFVDELLAGDMYFNLHTLTYPSGEIRGQIVAAAAAAVPEPAGFMMMALGLVCVGAQLQRR